MIFKYVQLKVEWENERPNPKDDNNGYNWGIYTYEVPIEDLNTDDMFNNEIVDVEWFKTPEERDIEFNIFLTQNPLV